MVIFGGQRWRKEKAKIEIRHNLNAIQKEFRKHLGNFIIGAFSFAAALLWRDAIAEVLKIFEFKGNFILYKFLSAAIISVIAIFMIMIISGGFKLEN